MIRKFWFLLLVVAFFNSLCVAQIGMGQWRMHIPHSNAIDVAYGNGMAMGALGSGVIAYDVAAGEYHVYDNMNGLSDIKVTCIVFHPATKSFIVGYESGNIDQILSDGSIQNISGVFLAQGIGNKRINHFTIDGGRILVATGFGIVVIDPVKHEIKDTYYPGNSVNSIVDVEIYNDTIYAIAPTTCYRGAYSNNFLSDPGQWMTDPRFTTPVDAAYGELAVLENELYVLLKLDIYGSDSVMKLNATGMDMFLGDDFDMQLDKLEIVNNKLALSFPNAVLLYGSDSNVFDVLGNYASGNLNTSAAVWDGGYYWIADKINGLVRFTSPTNYTFISKAGPPKEKFFSVNSYEDKIVVSGGILDRVNFEYSLSGAYTFQDENWTLYDKFNQPLWNSNANIFDVNGGAINPKNKDEMALSSYAITGLSLVSGSTVTQAFDATNSILENSSLGNGFTCVSAVEYDDDGNLWMCNGFSNAPLKVRTADGNWYEFDTGSSTKSKYTTKLAIDQESNKWFGVYGTGLVGYNDNGTPDLTSDDIYKVLSTGTGNGNLPSDNVTAIACDFDNEIWIGTESGFAVLYNGESIFTSDNIDASQILVKYEGNVEDLLGDTPISDIEIDGGNRKWIATVSSGLFMLSADGQEVLAYYSKENSPLISNSILDIDFNHITGELFIVTDLGLVSLRTDASYEDAKYETTTVFPNPVTPEYEGVITIQGIRYNSDVKITDVAGNLVYQTTSNGGTATWNGKTLTGDKAVSGVYMIWTATNEGKSKKVGKVAIVR